MFTLENLWVVLSLGVFAALIAVLVLLRRKLQWGFSARVVAALVLGIAFGVGLQMVFGAETASGAGAAVKKWVNIVGSIFIKSLQLIIAPLVLVSIVKAMSKLNGSIEGIKKAGKVISFLLITTAISAVVSIIVVRLFNLSASHLIEYTASTRKPADVATTILDLVPGNLFAALSGGSVLPVVFVAALIGFAYLGVKKSTPKLGGYFEDFIETAAALVMKIVDFVIQFTPYGVLAFIAVRTASGSGQFIVQLGYIILASYVALFIVFLLHLVIAAVNGLSPAVFLRKSAAALLFAFSSRSSAATVPLTIEAQRSLGVSEVNANLAATFGTCIGQNGCAGVYVPMLAILVGLAQGINVWSAAFLVPMVIYVVIASIGTAGVGGGATNVSLMVLSLLGLPIELVAILISVDFIIDMGRTLLNVNESILAGYVVGKLENDIDAETLHGSV